MMFTESKALKSFKRKLANPLNWRKANQLMGQFTQADLATMEGAKRLIDALASAFDITLTRPERAEAANWLRQQNIDPKSKRDRMLIWKKVN